jgi:hypothetical protein
MRSLVVGWFSFEGMGATAGDLLARDLVCEWIAATGISVDVALASPFGGGLDLRDVDPTRYTELIFVCGPFGNGPPITDLLSRFSHCRMIGVDLSMLQPLHEWNPFDLLLERDSSAATNPDISFLSSGRRVPVVGVVRVHHQKEYGDRAMHPLADEAIDRLLSDREIARIDVDTRLDVNETGLRTPAEVESVIARLDAVVTTRLHGMVLALKNGVPALAVDPIAGGAKIARQASTLGWPICHLADSLDDDALSASLNYCLTSEARAAAERCTARAEKAVKIVRDRFVSFVESPS